ncbi:MAG: protein kinase family protein [Candidatus Xenobia bacterium]
MKVVMTERVLRVRYHLQKRVHNGNGWRLFEAEDLRTGRPCLVYEVDLDSVAPRRQALLATLRQVNDPRFPLFTDMFTLGPRCYAVQNVVHGRTLADELRANPNGIGERAAAERGAQICELLLFGPDVDLLDPERLALTPDGLRVTRYDLDELESVPVLSRLRILAFILQALCGEPGGMRLVISRCVGGYVTLPVLRDELHQLAASFRPAYACVA